MAHSPSMSTNRTRLIGSAAFLPLGLLITIAMLIGSLILSIGLGAADIDVETVLSSLFRFDETNFNQLVIRTVRLPRVLAGVAIGAGLAVAGAVMQGLTSNPLADPGLLGIEAGAAFVVVLGVFFIGNPPLMVYALLAMIGATLAAFIVYGLSSLGRDGATPLKLTLTGAIFTAFTASLTSAILILDQNTLEQIRFWSVGSLAGREMPLLVNTAPLILIGVAGAWMLSRQITTISLGEDIARGLGQNTTRVKGVAALFVILMAGGAVALAGPVGFVGLVIPHVVRAIVGVDYRWIIPYSALFGALLVTLADTVGRIALRPLEIPIGIMLAFVGAPFFIYLARWKVRR
jgi:iron complex transport system permease protein